MNFVYVLHAPLASKIKIGTTNDVRRRVDEIRAMSPVPIEVIRILNHASFAVESTIHKLCTTWWSHGEWFGEAALPQALRWCDIVEAESAKIKAMTGISVETILSASGVVESAEACAQAIQDRTDAANAPALMSALYVTGGEQIAIIMMRSIMDRRYGSAA